jgi:hypothetical protein
MGAVRVAQMVERLISKCNTLSSTPVLPKKKKRLFGKMRPVETVPGMGRGRIKENDGGG